MRTSRQSFKMVDGVLLKSKRRSMINYIPVDFKMSAINESIHEYDESEINSIENLDAL